MPSIGKMKTRLKSDESLKADLHIHTNMSDGAMSPAAMMAMAHQAGMTVVSVTDHDTMCGVNEAHEAAQRVGLLVIPGVEISACDKEEMHLLAYGVAPDHQGLQSMLSDSFKDRQERILEMIQKLKSLHMVIEPGEAFNKSNDFTGRMNIALMMVSHGYVASTREAFEQYLGVNRPAFVPRRQIMPDEAIRRLVSFGCVVSLAHPGRLLMSRDALCYSLPGFIEAGLSAIEVYHPSHSEADVYYFGQIARQKKLLVTGGSDCHGRRSRGNAQIGDHMRLWRTVQEDTEALIHQINMQNNGTTLHSDQSFPIQEGK